MRCPHCSGSSLYHFEVREEVRCDAWTCVNCGQTIYGPSKLIVEPREVMTYASMES